MKRLCLLLSLLTLLLCSCLPTDLFGKTEQTTPQAATSEHTTLEENVTTSEDVTTPEDVAPPTPHEHEFGEAIVTKTPTCVQKGEKTAYCACGEAEVTEIPASGIHRYVGTCCVWCREADPSLSLTAVSSAYDADGDGNNDFYYFSTQFLPIFQNGVHVWAGDYDEDLSSEHIGRATFVNITHWYVTEDSGEYISYRVTVPETGIYEMAIYMRMKDSSERGSKYIINAGTDYEQVFQTSHAFENNGHLQVRNEETLGSYMYGIRVHLLEGENIIRIEQSTNSPKNQHYRDFYFVKVDDLHMHYFEEAGDVIEEATCSAVGQRNFFCTCGKSKVLTIPVVRDHTYESGICTTCGQKQPTMISAPSDYDANGDGIKDTYEFSQTLLDVLQTDAAIHVWAGDYDRTLSTSVQSTQTEGIEHWYVAADGTQHLVYRITVPETGVYEMVLHLRLKDAAERGTKYTVNSGTLYEQIFEVSHAFDDNTLKLATTDTVGTYMYGIRVNLVAGDNVIDITAATESDKCQHYRDLYFIKVDDLHLHRFLLESTAKEATCIDSGEQIYVCIFCGEHTSLKIPATRVHTYESSICIHCGQDDPGVGIIDYDFTYDTPGFAGGSFRFIAESTERYEFYWGDAFGALEAYTYLTVGAFQKGVQTEVVIHSYTAIPKDATRLLAISESGAYSYSFDIPVEHLFAQEELYTFGALADTHQGTRSGPESLSYDRLVNAGEILSQKGAVLIGINGDIATNNTEREYYLHGEAVKEIFGIDPTMPIYTVTGNHEAKYTGFSREWYDQYAREIVEYDTDLVAIYTAENDLDYVVEMPDGSVIIFLHQIYYDYGKATSRLMDDSQLDWLGECLEQYKDRTVFLFFHTEMQGKVGYFSNSNLVMATRTEDYKRLDAYFKQYTNVIFFSGHSHADFDKVFDEQYFDRVINSYDGEYATLVHLPSLAYSNLGHVVHVYEDYIVFEGYDFENGQTVAYGTFIIER